MWSVWSVFCDCGFHSAALWWIRIIGLWKLPDGREKWENWSCSDGWARLSKSLTQFSVGGQGCVLSQLFDLRPNSVEVMKILVTSFRRSCARTATVSAPALQQPTTDPHLLCRKQRRATKEPLDSERGVKTVAENSMIPKLRSWHLVPSLHGK